MNPNPDPNTKKKILVVEDDEAIRTILNQQLSKKGYHVIEACEGEEAIKKYQEHKPHLVVSDVCMPPGLDGIGMLNRLIELNEMPKIIYVSSTHKNEIQNTISPHIVGCLLKPYKFPELHQIIERELSCYAPNNP